MSSMIKRPSRKLIFAASQTPLCANVYDYSGNGGGTGGGSSGSGSFAGLVPASEIGLSSSGNTIGALNRTFIPSTITNPDRLLIGFPTSVALDPVTNSRTYVPIGATFSTSADVDIVQEVTTSLVKPAGTAGFYFRNEVESDYFYMIGSYSNSTGIGRRATILAIPKGTALGSATTSTAAGWVTKFTFAPPSLSGSATVFNPNTSFNAKFQVEVPSVVGALQPLTVDTSVPFGYYTKNLNGTFTYTPIVDDLTYVCYS